MHCVDVEAFKEDPIVDLLDSVGSALECTTFDTVSMRQGLCVALAMTSQRLEAVIEALYESKKADHVH